jgi:ribosomal protein S18 acetylase RimI-like enzyme
VTFVAKPVTPANFGDLEAVFNARGCSVARGCWCMYYRVTGRNEWPSARTSNPNRLKLKSLVAAGQHVGLVGYLGGVPAGWISFGPREDFAKLAKSPVMKPVDEERVWSVICFVVPSEFRKRGVARQLLDAAVAFCRRRKVKLLEGYPVDRPGRCDDTSLWFGTKGMFDAAGFEEIARRKPERPVVRLKVL